MIRQRPLAVVTMVATLTALTLAGCSPQSAGPAPEPDPDGATTFATLGIDDWPEEFRPLDDAPPAPEQLDGTRYAQLTGAIAGFARVATLDADLRDLEDPIPELTERLEDPFARLIPLVAEQETSPRVTLLNYFGEGVEVVEGPLVQHVWNVGPAADGGDGTTIALQTWAAYEVAAADGATGVIGVYREFARTERDNGHTGATWETAGVDTCALAVDDAMVPDPSDDQRDLLEQFAEEGSEHAFEVREVEGTITEEFKASCLDEG
jgi:hypothetical protein